MGRQSPNPARAAAPGRQRVLHKRSRGSDTRHTDQICVMGAREPQWAGLLGEAATPDTGDPTQLNVYWATRVTATQMHRYDIPVCS